MRLSYKFPVELAYDQIEMQRLETCDLFRGEYLNCSPCMVLLLSQAKQASTRTVKYFVAKQQQCAVHAETHLHRSMMDADFLFDEQSRYAIVKIQWQTIAKPDFDLSSGRPVLKIDT